MSSLRIEEKFTVPAPVERVWRFLLDPAQVAGCLPGARLDGSDGAGTFTGTMKVKVGPVTTEFRGKATFVEVDEAGRRMRLTGTGDDKAGGGSARMSMEGSVLAAADGGSEVTVTADVELAGKLVRFGRGMIEGVSKQLFKQFAERARTQLAAAPAPAPAAEATAPAAAASAPAPAPVAEPAVPAAPTPPVAEPVPAAPAPSAATPPPAAAEPAQSPPPAPVDAPKAELAPAAPTELANAAPTALAPVAPTALAPVAPTALAAAAPMELAPVAPSALAPAAPTALAPAAPTALAPTAPTALAPAAPSALAPAAPSALAPAQKEDEVLDAGALIWTVLWERITRFFRRLFGRRG